MAGSYNRLYYVSPPGLEVIMGDRVNTGGLDYSVRQGAFNFIEALKLLLYNRILNDEVIYFDTIPAGGRNTQNILDSVNITYRGSPNGYENIKLFFCFDGYDESINRESVEYNWDIIQKVHKFYEPEFDVECAIHKNGNTVVIFVGSDSLGFRISDTDSRDKFFTKLSASIPIMLKKYFDEKPITEDELDFLDKLNKGRRKAAEEAVSRLAVGILKASQGIMAQRLANLTNFSSKHKKKCIEDNIRDTNIQIDSILNTLSELYRQIDRDRADLLLLQQNLNQDSASVNSIIEYISNNPCIQISSVTENSMVINVYSRLTFFNKSGIMDLVNNPNSDLYFNNPAIRDDDLFKRMLTSIFDEQKYMIRMSGRFRADLDRCRTDGGSESTLLNHSTDAGFFANPHLYQYHCIGDNKPVMEEDLRNGDLIDYIEQCITSTETVVVGDPSFMFMISDLILTYQYDDLRRLPLFEKTDSREVCSMQDIVDEIAKNNENTAES